MREKKGEGEDLQIMIAPCVSFCRESQREVVLALVIGEIRAVEEMTDRVELGRL